MALKDTCKNMRSLLECIQQDLDKAEAGNKAAAQRVRTCSIKFEKAAKLYRKESIKDEKRGGGASGKKKGGAKASRKAAPSKPQAPASSKASKKKASTKKKKAHTRSMARKRPTAKLPKKK